MRVLFVCLGNICRSPMAEAIFQNLLEQRDLTAQMMCDSAGTANYHPGKRPDHRTMSVLQQRGIFTQHRARQITPDDFALFDYILAMDQDNFEQLSRVSQRFSGHRAKLLSMIDFVPQQSNPAGYTGIPDPYYGDDQDFQEVFALLYPGCEQLLHQISFEVC
jgi:protein-tyrosine phosphatase